MKVLSTGNMLFKVRDLKPANIFLLKGIPKIGDFGFAKKNEGGLKKHTSVGTPLYSSIEMLKN